MTSDLKQRTERVGWIGAGRMGVAMASRLLHAGVKLTVTNRTRTKTEPLAALGAAVVDHPAQLADCDIVFCVVAGPDSLLEVTEGANGLFSDSTRAPRLLADFSTVSVEASDRVRAVAAERGTSVLDTPVSGSIAAVASGQLAVVASGDAEGFALAEDYLRAIAGGVSYVGTGAKARVVKICHNMLLASVLQSLAEVTVLAEREGVPRRAFLDFINHSVLGSVFTGYKSPAMISLDFTPTFTPELMRKDLDLGLAAGRALEVPLPVTAQVREIVQSAIGSGHAGRDIAVLLEHAARAAGMTLKPE